MVMDWRLRRRDIWFMVDTLMPERRNKDHVVDAI
jgi:hypothetical protein